MATFSTNQVKHLYVAKAVDTNLDTVGDIACSAAGDKDIVLKYVGNDGIVRSDLINTDKIVYAKAIKASAMDQYLESAYVACSTAVAGQSYILKVIVDSFSSLSEEDKGFIFAEYTAAAGDSVSDILRGLALNLAKNASKAAYNSLIKVYVSTAVVGSAAAANCTEVTASTSSSSLSGTYKGLVIEAVDQPWTLGKEAFNLLRFNVAASTITSSGLETVWATITKNTVHVASAIHNSKRIADLEWFSAGERGDIYRGVGYPNNFEFSPLVNSAAAYGYHLIELAFYYDGDAEDVQKSPKEIVIVAPAEGATTYTVINNVAAAINSAAGSTVVAQLS